jgi:predicted nucleotidyltransferase/DNA-binding XRE family transcriptional regulator
MPYTPDSCPAENLSQNHGQNFSRLGQHPPRPAARVPREIRISTIRHSGWVTSEDLTAAGLLRHARQRAGMSQVELAAWAGVTQSVISAYESGHRQPSVPTLAALIEAAGFELATAVRRQPRRLKMLSGPVGRRVRRRRHDLVAAAAAHGVSGLRLFGSVARGKDRPDSDVDLLADLPAGMSLFGLARLQAELEAIVGTRVDLVPAADLKPEVRERAGRDLIVL